MNTPKKRYAAFVTSIALVVGNLALANWISDEHFFRADLTRGKVHTLHPATVKLLEGLDDLVTFQVFISEQRLKENPSFATWPRDLRDLLTEFAVAADGKLRIEYLDPSDDPEKEQLARQAGMQAYQLQGTDEGRVVVVEAFLGLVASYGPKTEPLQPAYQSEQSPDLEFRIAMAVSKLTQRELVTIGFAAVKGLPEGLPPQLAAQMGQEKDEHELNGDYGAWREALSKQFQVEEVKLDKEVPPHVQLLVLANTKGLSEVNKFHVDQFLMRGGQLVVLADGIEVNPQFGTPTPRGPENDEFFAHYGFTIHKNVVLDQQCLMQLLRPPVFLIPQLQSEFFDPESALMNGVPAFYLPLASSIELNPKPGVTALVLARSSPAAWKQEGMIDINPTSVKPPTRLEDYQQFDMVGLLSGEFESFFSNRPLPAGLTPSSTGPTLSDIGGSLPDDAFGGDDHDHGDGDAGDQGDASDEAEEDEPEDGGGGGGEQDVPGGGIASAQDEPAQVPAPEPAPEQVQGEAPASAPEGEAASAPAASAPAVEPPSLPFVKAKSPAGARILVVGNSQFLAANYLRGLPGNLDFFWTLAERMTTGSSLTDVKNRFGGQPSVRADLSAGDKAALKYLGMLGMPVIVLIAGVAFHFMRRSMRRAS